ncbi:hypothetical protein AB1L05_14320 [Cytobacillus horneckiae]|uniref:Uncharacterized protein n=1 Tax=Cytobacillus horneckiae TaxID=549687 RepID=A0A2N0ZAB9_9BACI|nr:hypothetical protein [Cytobacillus horneckiae]MCM3176624.1 hypothetical protein [Cytobacillus horneckiae]MEC1158541.1 hypothetical protein [Cytobacillus horneckiae]MED2939644.1 hypothetical protein [Cytobacillus horneckiae]PKG26440.1 hypothetical protein CWS20_24005 [Cytobacillus horneckiae]
MKSENVRRYSKERRHRGEGKDHKSGRHGAKTFRRGRALAFLEMMNLKRSTLKQQLKTPERQSIHPIGVGELNTQLFEIHESEITVLPILEKNCGEERNSN